MTDEGKKLLIVQAAGLGCNLMSKYGDKTLGELEFKPMQAVFPAVTCAAQAAFRTGTSPEKAGMYGNGFLNRELGKVMFWEQSSALVKGERIWEKFRASGKTVGMLFWQQSMGEQVDIVLSPAPIHKHHGGMIQDCYCQPAGLYERLCREIGREFRLKDYWGPIASAKASQWIAEATACVIAMDDAPDLCMTYLPALDYDLQRHGIDHDRSRDAVKALMSQLNLLKGAAAKNGYELVVFGDYAIVDSKKGAVYPNRELRKADYMKTRNVNGMLYPDIHESLAFAVADHEAAYVYLKNKDDKSKVVSLLKQIQGVASVEENLDSTDNNVPDLVAVAEEGYWFAYQWWDDSKQAPEYAAHVDIHSKPGYDPCELFFGKLPWLVSVDPAKIGGSHGRTGEGREVCWASTLWNDDIKDLLELSQKVKDFLTGE